MMVSIFHKGGGGLIERGSLLSFFPCKWGGGAHYLGDLFEREEEDLIEN